MSDNDNNDPKVIKADFGGAPYPRLGDLYEDIMEILSDYDGELPALSIIGVLEFIKADIINDINEPG